MATLNKAIEIAAKAHEGKFEKAGDPYIFHPLRMMMKMTSEAARITAVLHDVVEDSVDNPPETKWTFDRLREDGFSDEIIEAVDGVTNRPGESHDEFYGRAGANTISRAVKIADFEDNMNMLRLDVVKQSTLDRLTRYHRSWKRLTSMERNEYE